MSALAFVKPPPFVPSILMAICEAMGLGRLSGYQLFVFHYRFPLGILQSLTTGILFLDLSRVWFDQFHRIIGFEILDHALGDQKEA